MGSSEELEPALDDEDEDEPLLSLSELDESESLPDEEDAAPSADAAGAAASSA